MEARALIPETKVFAVLPLPGTKRSKVLSGPGYCPAKIDDQLELSEGNP